MVVTFLAKAAVGMVVSKIVGKITGSELLGALAGGFVGAGFGFDSATGAMSWSNPLEGLGAASASSGVASVGVDPAGLVGDAMGGASDFTMGAVTGGADLSTVNMMGGAITDTVSSGAGSGIASMGSQTLMGAAAPSVAAAAAPASGGMLSDATGWLDKHPTLAKIGGDLVSGALSPDKIDMIEAQGDQDRLTLIERQKQELAAKQAVDPNALAGRLDSVNQGVFAGGYQPGSLQSALSGFTPGYSTMNSPNYDSRVNAVYTIPSKEEV